MKRRPPRSTLFPYTTLCRSSAETTNVGLYIQCYTDPAMNWATAEALRRYYEPLVDQYSLRVDAWHTSGLEKKRDRVLTRVEVGDRKSTRLNSSHANISYAVF